MQIGLPNDVMDGIKTQAQEDALGYLHWHEYAERKHRKGMRQSYCEACGKWRWPDVTCCGGRRVKKPQEV